MKYTYSIGKEKKIIRCPICGGCHFKDNGFAYFELRCDICSIILRFDAIEHLPEDDSDSLQSK